MSVSITIAVKNEMLIITILSFLLTFSWYVLYRVLRTGHGLLIEHFRIHDKYKVLLLAEISRKRMRRMNQIGETPIDGALYIN